MAVLLANGKQFYWQCHPRESGDLLDQTPNFQNEVPAFAGMTLLVVR